MKIDAIIPLKEESVRVPNKNFKNFGNTTLIDIKIKSLLKIKNINNIIINSNSKEILNNLKNKYPRFEYVLRESYYASSECSGSEFFENIAINTNSDVLIYSPVTSPFIKSETLILAIQSFLKETEYDSVVSVHDMKHHMWMNNKPLNYDPVNSPNSQDLPTVNKITYGFGIISRELMIKRRNIVGEKPFFYEVDELEAVDIDTNLDFEFAEFLYNKFRYGK